MWSSSQQRLNDKVLSVGIQGAGGMLSFGEAMDLMRGGGDAFRRFFIDLLRDCPFRCFRFEMPPVTAADLHQPFELVLVDSPGIDLPADPADFQGHFDERPDDILVFDNLGGDATMIVPRPRQGGPGYAHIAGFTRHAPLDQQQALWRTVAETVHRSLGDAPLWLNTAGGGVPWLHVRLDSRPKYYVFDPYRCPSH